MSCNSVIVLGPNGRRQTVKVTHGSSVLQILEEVCVKQGFDPQQYDLRHQNKILDTSSLVRYTNLTNNAFLEMVEAKNLKLESPVTVALQLESGERLVHDFLPKTLLSEIIHYWNSDMEKILHTYCHAETELIPVCIYMTREIVGKLELERISLRSLGLTSGRAIIRFIYKKKEVTHEEPLPSSNVMTLVEEIVVQPVTVTISEDQPCDTMKSAPNISLKESHYCEKESEISDRTSTELSNLNEIVVDLSKPDDCFVGKKISTVLQGEPSEQKQQVATPHVPSRCVHLGKQGFIIFRIVDLCHPVVELPDDFFEVTMDDVQYLMADLKRQRTMLEDKPLLTQASRESICLAKMQKYPRTVIRIQFADRIVIQGVFGAQQKVLDVKNFVRECLADKELPFYLFTTPPKQMLDENQILLEESLVPAALVHFGSDASRDTYLSQDLVNQLNSLGEIENENPSAEYGMRSYGNQGACSSEAKQEQMEPMETSSAKLQHTRKNVQGKMPKWFTVGRK